MKTIDKYINRTDMLNFEVQDFVELVRNEYVEVYEELKLEIRRLERYNDNVKRVRIELEDDDDDDDDFEYDFVEGY